MTPDTKREIEVVEASGCGKMSGLEATVEEFLRWADETFPNATPETCIAHLRSEVAELSEEGGARDPEELADAAMLVFHAAHKAGVDLTDALWAKLEKNRRREWGAPNEEGYREHVRHPTEPERGEECICDTVQGGKAHHDCPMHGEHEMRAALGAEVSEIEDELDRRIEEHRERHPEGTEDPVETRIKSVLRRAVGSSRDEDVAHGPGTSHTFDNVTGSFYRVFKAGQEGDRETFYQERDRWLAYFGGLDASPTEPEQEDEDG